MKSSVFLCVLLFSSPLCWARGLSGAALSQARQWLNSGDPAKVRAVARSFQLGADDASLELYRSLLVESKRSLETRFDAGLGGELARTTTAENKLEEMLTLRLMVIGVIPRHPDDPFDTLRFQEGLTRLVKQEAECAALYARPEASRLISQPVQPGIAESLTLINAELARFYPESDAWLGLPPLAGSFRGAHLRERRLRVGGYLAELQSRPEIKAAGQSFFKDRPAALASAFDRIQNARRALGLPLLKPDATLSGVAGTWAGDVFDGLDIPADVPETAESDLEQIARKANFKPWIRKAVTLPGKASANGTWPAIPASAALVPHLYDARANVVGMSLHPTGIVLVFAEESARETGGTE